MIRCVTLQPGSRLCISFSCFLRGLCSCLFHFCPIHDHFVMSGRCWLTAKSLRIFYSHVDDWYEIHMSLGLRLLCWRWRSGIDVRGHLNGVHEISCFYLAATDSHLISYRPKCLNVCFKGQSTFLLIVKVCLYFHDAWSWLARIISIQFIPCFLSFMLSNHICYRSLRKKGGNHREDCLILAIPYSAFSIRNNFLFLIHALDWWRILLQNFRQKTWS